MPPRDSAVPRNSIVAQFINNNSNFLITRVDKDNIIVATSSWQHHRGNIIGFDILMFISHFIELLHISLQKFLVQITIKTIQIKTTQLRNSHIILE